MQEARNRDYLDVRQLCTNRTNQFNAVFFRHTQIQNNQIKITVDDGFPSIPSVGRLGNKISNFLQSTAKHAARFGIIFCHENRGNVWDGSLFLCHLLATWHRFFDVRLKVLATGALVWTTSSCISRRCWR